ncbi:basement membrane-specific heparan sulfate proteoglycan core protein-like isoform X3 [Podarcis raffonei]|uniref:basement membrane-specific heparan sulfate proteoglycan core protein-like isoform X3 n=1 Tax=Podarcis raffonei TaxID=65483 RepID=UPI002329934B|nr:basement membrane-specific heparan sulfate proteoglycan core protein-like isoform X3 [Podarcis raffonei]
MKSAALVTVCLQILLGRSVQADLPRAPVFSVSPKKDVYTRGESVELKCSSSETRHVSRTQFFRDQQDLHSVKPSSPSSLNNVTHTLRLVIQDGGDYSCRYHIVESGREIASRESNSIRISLSGRLRPPFFSVSPKLDMYSSGEIVNLTCSVPENLMSRVLFKKDQWLLRVYTPPSPLASFTYTRRLSPQDSGEHLCTYRAAESSQNISSPESSRIRISVMAPPPAPVLTVDPPSGVVKEGGFLRLTCSAFGSDAEQRFHFYKDGVKISSSSEESLVASGEPRNAFSTASANTLVQVTASIHTGGFACRYEQKLSSRWIMSPWSQTVNLTGEPCPTGNTEPTLEVGESSCGFCV